MKPQARSPGGLNRKPVMRRALSEDAQDAYVHLLSGGLNIDGLARAMRISRSKAFRLVSELRRGGHEIEVRKDGRCWHYEVLEDVVALWRNDPVMKLAGFIKSGPILKPGEDVDDILYGPLKKKR